MAMGKKSEKIKLKKKRPTSERLSEAVPVAVYWMAPNRKRFRARTDFRFSKQMAFHPDHLWTWRPGVYVDENDRSWVPVFIEEQGAIKVLIRQENIPLEEAVCCSHLPPNPLPLLWRYYPDNRYQGSDSSFWRILYHIQVAGTEELLLQQLPDL